MQKKLLEDKACHPATAATFYIWMLQTPHLTVLLILFPLFLFLVFTKCQVVNFRAGRSRDQVLQWAHYFLFRVWLNFCRTSFRRIHHCLAIVSQVSQWLSCTEQPKQSVLFISCESKKKEIANWCIFWMMSALLSWEPKDCAVFRSRKNLRLESEKTCARNYDLRRLGENW